MSSESTIAQRLAEVPRADSWSAHIGERIEVTREEFLAIVDNNCHKGIDKERAETLGSVHLEWTEKHSPDHPFADRSFVVVVKDDDGHARGKFRVIDDRLDDLEKAASEWLALLFKRERAPLERAAGAMPVFEKVGDLERQNRVLKEALGDVRKLAMRWAVGDLDEYRRYGSPLLNLLSHLKVSVPPIEKLEVGMAVVAIHKGQVRGRGVVGQVFIGGESCLVRGEFPLGVRAEWTELRSRMYKSD